MRFIAVVVPRLQVFLTRIHNVSASPFSVGNSFQPGTTSQSNYESREETLSLPSNLDVNRIFDTRNPHCMKCLIITFGLALFLTPAAVAREQSMLARVTVYWHSNGPQQRACSTGARLRPGQCAVDPKKIPYGSTVLFPDGPSKAVDTGPAVVSRKAARLSGKTPGQRNALVIDRYFETKKEALAWANANPHFMTVQVVSPGSSSKSKEQPKSDVPSLAPMSCPPPGNESWWSTNATPLKEAGSNLLNVISPADLRGGLISAFLASCYPDP